MRSVRAVLNQDKLPKEYPPTMADVRTREKHVPESIDYNIKHFRDHGKNVVEQLKKLKMVDPAKARRYAEKSCAAVESVYKELEGFKNGKES